VPTLVAPLRKSRWRYLNFSTTSTYRNLAVEEAIALAFSNGTQTDPTIRMWVNPKAVIVGRFQEVVDEVDLAQCDANGLQVARRFTGGGTVFHDLGTLNFTMLDQRRPDSMFGFQERNLQLVVDALGNLGIRSSLSPPNSILIDGRKVCGASAAVGAHFALWHCSILVDTDIRLLELTLAPSKIREVSRFVRSRWQPVTSLAKALAKTVTVNDLKHELRKSVERGLRVRLEDDSILEDEARYAEALNARKYSLDAWNLRGNHGFVWGKEEVEEITRRLPCESAPRP